jgi:UPF0176 protein
LNGLSPDWFQILFQVAAFYQFAPLAHYAALQTPLLDSLKASRVKGSVLLAPEGINGTIAATAGDLQIALSEVRRITGLGQLEHKLSFAQDPPFKRMKVRLKKEIVTIGDVAANPNEIVGTHVEPASWNALISDPDVVVIDTRNDYEVEIGTFKGAINPRTERFGAFPDFVRNTLQADKSKMIAMFCTGGIRCEKASSFMRNEGFENVYHLKGGILKYLELVPRDESLWEGGCFVFDERVAVGHGLEPGNHSICHGCLKPVSSEQRQSANYEDGVCCDACANVLTDVQKASNRERQRQYVLARKRGTKHLGPAD